MSAATEFYNNYIFLQFSSLVSFSSHPVVDSAAADVGKSPIIENPELGACQ